MASLDTLHSDVARRLGARHRRWVAVRVTADKTEVVTEGIEPSDDVEIVSMSKPLTGQLYVEALSRGEITPETVLADLLPLEGSSAGAITLASLATHTSGLPRLASQTGTLAATWALWRHGINPYGADLETLIQRAALTTVGRPRPSYSNLGFMLLGHAVAAAAGTTYAALVADRLVTPLGLADTFVPAGPDDLRPQSIVGTNSRGRSVEPWTGVDLGPAGGIRMSANDLAAFLNAVLAGTAPGLAALDPVRQFGGRANRIGAGWMTLQSKTGEVTWHNGGTGGFRSIMTLDRARYRGVGIVSATSRSVDQAGFDFIRPAS